MGFLFEIYGEDGQLTKSGKVKGKKMMIPSDENDARFIIRYDSHPHAIYKEGILNGKRKAKSDWSVRYTAEIGDIIEAHVLHPDETVFHEVNGVRTAYQGQSIIHVPRTAGRHVFYNEHRTEELSFRCIGETPDARILKCAHSRLQQTCGKKMASFAEEKGVDGHEAILLYMEDAHKKGRSEEEMHESYLLLKQYEALSNSRNRKNAKDAWGVDNDVGCAIEATGEIDSVVVYRIEGKKKTYVDRFMLSSRKDVFADDFSALLIEGYLNGQFVSARHASILPASLRSLAWKKKKEEEEAYLAALEKGLLASRKTEESISAILSLEESMGSHRNLLDRPMLVDRYEDHIELLVRNTGLLEALGKPFYLAFAKVSEAASAERVARIALTGDYALIDTYENGIPEEEDLLAWIEDEDRIMISDPALLTGKKETEEDLLNAYDNYWWNRHEQMIQQAIDDKNNPGYGKLVGKLLEDKISESGTGFRHLADHAITELFGQHMWEASWHAIRMLLSMRQGIGAGAPFFDTPLDYNEKEQVLFLPPSRRNYLLVVEEFYEDEKQKTVRFFRNPPHVIIKGDYAVVHSVDEDSYDVSGFAMLGGKGKKPLYATDKLNVRLI